MQVTVSLKNMQALQVYVHSCTTDSDFKVIKRNCIHRFLCHSCRIGIQKETHADINFKAQESTPGK